MRLVRPKPLICTHTVTYTCQQTSARASAITQGRVNDNVTERVVAQRGAMPGAIEELVVWQPGRQSCTARCRGERGGSQCLPSPTCPQTAMLPIQPGWMSVSILGFNRGVTVSVNPHGCALPATLAVVTDKGIVGGEQVI